MSSSKNYLVSFFDNLKNVKPIENIDIQELFISIKNGKWKSDIEKCQIDVSHKKDLPCFTPTGIFKKRNSQGIENYSGIICLDIDHIENPEKLKTLCKSIPWVWVAFITPSGKGLKVFAQTIPELTPPPPLIDDASLYSTLPVVAFLASNCVFVLLFVGIVTKFNVFAETDVTTNVFAESPAVKFVSAFMVPPVNNPIPCDPCVPCGPVSPLIPFNCLTDNTALDTKPPGEPINFACNVT